MDNEYIKAKLETLPLEPGCYLMKDIDNVIIYVGKAKKLKNRVNQYFHGAHNYKTTKMISNINDFEYIVTSSEKEALILENNLIKKHRPRFNILMMDDKTYPYIKITKEKHPRVCVVRNVLDKKAKHFGPFSDSTAAYDVMKLINRIYPLRKCDKLPKRACLYYHLGQCLGPCINDVEETAYESTIKQVTSFLNGDTKSIISTYEKEMLEASENLDFEKAKKLRDLIISINHVMDPQKMESNANRDFDVFAYNVNNGYISIAGLMIRSGKLIERQIKIFEIYDEIAEVFMSFLMQYYETNLIPKELYIPSDLDIKLIEEVIPLKIFQPLKGEKLRLVELAQNNASILLKQKFDLKNKVSTKNEKCMEEFKELLGMGNLSRIEMFDNSHINGTDRVSGMIVIDNGEFMHNEYRKFKIKGDAKDDLNMMKEVVYRRYLRLIKEDKPLPNMLLMDGGILQIEAAKEVMDTLELPIPIYGLAKDDKHNTAKLVDINGKIIDVERNSDLFFFLTRIQDEVHRFAITFHQDQRSAHLKKSVLDEVEGIGEIRKKKLYAKFKSIKGLKAASLEEINEILPEAIASNLFEFLKSH